MVGSGKEVILGSDACIGCNDFFSLRKDLGIYLNSNGFYYLVVIDGGGRDNYGSQNWLSAEDLGLAGVAANEWEHLVFDSEKVGIVM